MEGDGESLSASEPNESNSQATSPAIVTTTHSYDISANPRADTSSVVNTPEVVSKSPAIMLLLYGLCYAITRFSPGYTYGVEGGRAVVGQRAEVS